ncbi:Ada metal-binding domain-containing protein [Candidatus Solirubrobacter pratensis]|uniref:Ada metal-binding domain-containing protein n=1 Tax=Candidatus Solirubrobacter pratensis TaxID=1298857 RepID=UPI002100D28D|nr:Ada metal-binding domain-containing protein [Candidatus Solirubrobacter pratensis]
MLGTDGVAYESAAKGRLGGHARTRVYGRLDCPVALSLLRRGLQPRHRVFFADEATAVAAGFRPCGACMREEYRTWKARAG